jgi:hypothetical protein
MVKGHTALHQAAGLHHRTVFRLVATPVQNETGPLAGWLMSVFALLVLLVTPARAATWYVDNSLGASGNGQSWASAWTSLPTSGVSAGDTVYISGGSSSQTYNTTGWSPPGGSAGNPVYYKIGTDSTHNGTVIIDGGGTWNFFKPNNNVDINGNVGGTIHLVVTHANAATGSTPTCIFSSTGQSGIALRYIEFAGGIMMDSASGMEFDHCKWDPINFCNRQLFLQNLNVANPAENIVHDCIFQPVYGTSGLGGDDGIAGYSLTVSNCYFFPQLASGTYGYGTSQHPDMIQTSAGQILVCNNWFQGMRNYGFYGEWSYSGSYMHVVNNVFIAGSDQPISIGPNGTVTASDVLVANNLIIDCSLGLYFWGGGNSGSTLSNARCYNNLTINSGNNNIGTISYSGSIAQADNLTSFPTSGFVSYTKGAGTNNDFHLNSTATTAIGQGANLSSDFTFDRDGNQRQSGAWDIGPYIYGTISSNPAISVQPSPSLDFGSVLTNTTEDLAFTVQNSGGGNLSGTATVSPPFSIVAGGTYNLGASQSTNVTIRFSPNAVGAHTNTVTFTVAGGNGTTRTVSGTGAATYIAPIVSGSLTLQPSAGSISSPFVLSSGYVSQSVTTGTNGGQLVFSFQTTNSGLFAVVASVNAPNSGANSFYVNIDAPPTDPVNIWDIPMTTGFTNEIVTWRGNGTNDQTSIYPQQNFSLNAGLHQLIIEGREAGTELGPVTIVQLQPPPQPPFVMP